jgi:hypothetical protein
MAYLLRTTPRRVLPALLILAAVVACATPLPTATRSPTAVPEPTAAPTPEPTATPTPLPTATPTPTETPEPTDTPLPTATPTPTPTPTPTASPTPLPESVLLEPMNHQWQTHNNCGPASVAILLGYYGHSVTQQKVNERLPPGPRPCDTVSYMSRYGLTARLYILPSPRFRRPAPIRLLLANRIPVIVHQQLSSEDPLGHYRVIHGYDDASGEFISDDPLLGPGLRLSYRTFTTLSHPGSAFFIPVYPPEADPLVQSLMESLGLKSRAHLQNPSCKSRN